MPLMGFEPTISAGKRPQTFALDLTATLTGFQLNYWNKLIGKVCTLLVILTYMYQDARFRECKVFSVIVTQHI